MLKTIMSIRRRAEQIVRMCDAVLEAHARAECARYDRARGRLPDRRDSADSEPIVILGPGGDYTREIR